MSLVHNYVVDFGMSWFLMLASTRMAMKKLFGTAVGDATATASLRW